MQKFNLTEVLNKLLASKGDSEVALAEICKKDFPKAANIVYSIVAKLLVYASLVSGIGDEKTLIEKLTEVPEGSADITIEYAVREDVVKFDVLGVRTVFSDLSKGPEKTHLTFKFPAVLHFEYTKNGPAVFLGEDTTADGGLV